MPSNGNRPFFNVSIYSFWVMASTARWSHKEMMVQTSKSFSTLSLSWYPFVGWSYLAAWRWLKILLFFSGHLCFILSYGSLQHKNYTTLQLCGAKLSGYRLIHTMLRHKNTEFSMETNWESSWKGLVFDGGSHGSSRY